MFRFFQVYLEYIKIFVKARAEYRLSFFLKLFTNFYSYFIVYITYLFLINGVGSIESWDFSDLSILYGLSLITYAVSGAMFWNNVYHMEKMITTGKIDIILMRPLGALKQLMFQKFGDTFIGQIVISVIFLTVAIYKKIGCLSLFGCIYLPIAMIGGILIQSGSMIIIGSLSFWTFRTSEIGSIVYYDIRNMTKYPISIYPKWIQYGLTYLFPWGFINYYPALLFLNKIEKIGEFVLALISPLIGVIVFLIGLIIFNSGLKQYSGSGS